ncbi:MAG: tetratricopeptide repeat protein, partial [Ginsengibacter sp.]
WGKRQNTDNWRRAAAGGIASNNNAPGNDPSDPSNPNGLVGNPDGTQSGDSSGTALKNPAATPVQLDISVDGLLANVPVTKDKLDMSNSKVSLSLFELGKNYQSLLEDYGAAVETYERSLNRFPDSLYKGEIYLNLSYCYRKLGDLQKADYYKNLLLHKFEKSKYAQLVTHPESMDPSKKDTAATKRYEGIYNLFIEGNFETAIKDKQQADSIYGTNYWSPQLLYIESVYYIRKKDDSTATKVLEEIITQYPASPLKDKAATMIDVLKRRSSIESYLSKLTIERAKEDSQIIVYDDAMISKGIQPAITNNSNQKPREVRIIPQKVVIDSSKRLAPPVTNGTFTFDPLTPQYVVMVLNKVDPVYSSEAKNALTRYNREKFFALGIQVTRDTLDKDRTLLVFAQFETADAAISYRDKIKKDAASEISWLPADKYSFYIISPANLELLKQNKSLQNYIELLNKKYPGKF